MPTLSSMKIPPPKSWEEFEEITLDSCKIRWENPDLQMHGRQGQAQNGVDIFGANHIFQNVGIQCKNYDTQLTLSLVKKEVEKAKSFKPTIEMFYLAATNNTDANLQTEVRLLSQRRTSNGEFPVMILFWNDIIQELVKKKETFSKHYPDIHIQSSGFNLTKSIKLYSVLDMVYNALTLDFHNEMIFGDFGELAGEDPLQIQSSLLIIKYSASNVMNKEDYSKVSMLIDDYHKYLFPKSERTEEFDWNKANQISNEFIGMIKGVQYNLDSKEIAIYNISKTLSMWTIWETKSADNAWPEESWTALKQLIKTVEIESLDEEIIILQKEYNEGDHWVKLMHPHKVYNVIRRYLTL
jgi:hypothetical protein